MPMQNMLSRDGITYLVLQPPSKEQTPSLTLKDPEINLHQQGRRTDLSKTASEAT